MFETAIHTETKRVLEKIGNSKLTKNFYLAGGTALALQLGHRESVDLDWFSAGDFSNGKIKEQLGNLGNFLLSSEEEGTIHGSLDGVKLSFLRYPYALLFPARKYGKILVADERDIAAMKIDAISARGSKKDFIDIYFLLQKYNLSELFDYFDQKFSSIKYNKLHLLKSIVYFQDAEAEPIPVMLKPADWKQVKKNLFQATKNFFEKK